MFPAFIELFFRLLGLTILSGVLAFEEATEDSCAAEFHLNIYLVVAIVLFSLTILNLGLLGAHSARGSIWDADKRPRRLVRPLVSLSLEQSKEWTGVLCK